MDQGTATVWAAGLGIVGTLGGALGGAYFASRSAARQVTEQEAVDVRHRVRDERRTAYATLLDQTDVVMAALDPIIVARFSPDWAEGQNRREMWAPANEALKALQRAVTAIAITGPDDMQDAAQAIHDATLRSANALRAALPYDEMSIEFAAGTTIRDAAREGFVEAARRVLGAPGR